MSHFYTPWFSDIFRGYRNVTLDYDGLMLSGNSFQTVLVLSEECWRIFSNSTFCIVTNYKFLLFVIFIEVGVNCFPGVFLEWKGKKIIFPDIFQAFLSLCGPNFGKNIKFRSIFRTRLKKVLFKVHFN